MKTFRSFTTIIIIYFYSNQLIYGQNGSASLCINAEPLCGASQFSYPNTSGINFAESRPDYGCIRVQLNPSWFYLQIAQDGDIQLQIEQSTTAGGFPNLDVDFIIYGPFNDPRSPCTSNLTVANTMDCSYATDFVEYVDIANTLAGEYYLLLITNFSQKEGFITVTQTDGSATTNCVFLADPIVSNKIGCKGEPLTLDATTLNAVNYIWYEDDGSETGNYAAINGINTANHHVEIPNKYKVDVFDSHNVLIEKYQFNVQFAQPPTVPSYIQDYTICDRFGDNDGIGEFDLSSMDVEILNALNPSDFSVAYYSDLSDANSGIDQLPLSYINSLPTEVIYARIDNISSKDAACFDIGTFNIVVNLLPVFDLAEDYILCVNTNGTEEIATPPMIDTGLDLINYSFKWYLNSVELPVELGPTIIAKQDGKYSVETTNLATGCSNVAETMVNLSAPPLISASVRSFAFSNNHVLEATATGSAYQEYEFRLDSGAWQDHGTFKDVSFGEHTITARDINGCGQSRTTVMVIDYPHYFTPNGDGHHDTWNIEGIAYQQQAKIYLYDRYGKLLKQLSPASSGWDGTYHGAPLPSNDYWFTVEYIEPRDSALKQFKAHFSLMR